MPGIESCGECASDGEESHVESDADSLARYIERAEYNWECHKERCGELYGSDCPSFSDDYQSEPDDGTC